MRFFSKNRLLNGSVIIIVLLTFLHCGGSSEIAADTSEDHGEDSTDDPADSEYSGPTVPLVLTIHMEAYSARECDPAIPEIPCVTDEQFEHNRQKMEEFIASLNANGLKGTFQHQIQWITRLSQSEQGLALITSLIEGGHEIALHHHGFDHHDWDGYSDNPAAYEEPHHNTVNLEPQPMSAYMDIVHLFETEHRIELLTIEGTDFDYDWQGEWEFKTTDASGGEPLNDPEGLCPTENTRWSQISLPSISYKDLSLPVWGLTHTNFMGFTPECQRLKEDHVFAYLDGVDPNALTPTDAVNLVFHVEDYAQDELTLEYDAFFESLSEYSFIKAMTVSDYMCDRVGQCAK